MPAGLPARAHVITGGFPPGQDAGHDHDYARLRLLELLHDAEVPASTAGDFTDIQKWLPVSRLLITYVAGPYPDAEQTAVIRRWVEEGGHWLGLHGTAGGRAVRVEGMRQRRMLKLEHHSLLGGYFLTHPPIRRFTVDVGDAPDTLTNGLPASFEVADEPYFIEIQDPATTRVLLTTRYGPEAVSAAIGTIYDQDTSLMEDGKTRALGYVRDLGRGGVTYIALGHCHNPTNNSQPSVDRSVHPEGTTPLTFRDPWETAAFQTLLRNGLTWGMGASAGSATLRGVRVGSRALLPVLSLPQTWPAGERPGRPRPRPPLPTVEGPVRSLTKAVTDPCPPGRRRGRRRGRSSPTRCRTRR
ncbi:MAG: ThuA domain-containing protein [Dehalococcoidia bacterium]